MAEKLNIDPFEGLASAPGGHLKMANDTKKFFKLEINQRREAIDFAMNEVKDGGI